MTRAEFEALAADYYDANDSETLSHETIEDAVEDYLDRRMEPGCDVLSAIREHSPVEVVAHQRGTVPDSWIEDMAHVLLDRATEGWGKEYGDPDGGGEFDAKVIAKHLPAMVAVVRAFLAEETVWRCERVGEYTYDAEEVEAMMREHRPDWFVPVTMPTETP